MSALLATGGLALVAGALSTLSPCVLPLVPILVASASAQHRYGPFALAIGLTLSFSSLGILIAASGASLGLGGGALRAAGALVLLAFGMVLISQRLQQRFAQWTTALSAPAQNALARFSFNGFAGQGLLGLLLGVVWTPCVGPTLGATIALASQGKNLADVTFTMLLFGIGAALPLLLLGLLSKSLLGGFRTRLAAAANHGKRILGVALVAIGIAVLTGIDKKIETWALDAMPAWMTDITTAI